MTDWANDRFDTYAKGTDLRYQELLQNTVPDNLDGV